MTNNLRGTIVYLSTDGDWCLTGDTGTANDVRNWAIEDHVYNLDNDEYVCTDYGLRLADGSVTVVVKATDALADICPTS